MQSRVPCIHKTFPTRNFSHLQYSSSFFLTNASYLTVRKYTQYSPLNLDLMLASSLLILFFSASRDLPTHINTHYHHTLQHLHIVGMSDEKIACHKMV